MSRKREACRRAMIILGSGVDHGRLEGGGPPVVVLNGGPQGVPEASWLELRPRSKLVGRRHLPDVSSTARIAMTSLLDTRTPSGRRASLRTEASGRADRNTKHGRGERTTPTCGSAAIGPGPGRDVQRRWFDRVERLYVQSPPSPVSQPGFRNASSAAGCREDGRAVREPDGDRVTGRGRSRDTNRRRPDHALGR